MNFYDQLQFFREIFLVNYLHSFQNVHFELKYNLNYISEVPLFNSKNFPENENVKFSFHLFFIKSVEYYLFVFFQSKIIDSDSTVLKVRKIILISVKIKVSHLKIQSIVHLDISSSTHLTLNYDPKVINPTNSNLHKSLTTYIRSFHEPTITHPKTSHIVVYFNNLIRLS